MPKPNVAIDAILAAVVAAYRDPDGDLQAEVVAVAGSG